MKEYNKIIEGIRDHLYGFNYRSVACSIYGKITYLSEAEVRALQLVARLKAQESYEAFKEFTENVIVYSNHRKVYSDHRMVFRKDGTFENQFEDGFLRVNKELEAKLRRDISTCCICGREYFGVGYRPSPLIEQGMCCERCYKDVVLKARATFARR